MRIGIIEGGGTKFICGVGNENGEIEEYINFPTQQPEQTLGKVIEYFQTKDVEAIGIGMFGPIDVNASSQTYGYVTSTPKPGWSNTDVLGILRHAFNIPFGWDTDVNAAALGESKWGAAKGLDSCVYITVGTGIGFGIIVENTIVHGLTHPEGGHVFTRRHPEDAYPGYCVFHKDCLEGMASGPAIEKRWGTKCNELQEDHPAWRLESFYLAQAILNAILLLSPKKIILGGGVMNQRQLFPLIHCEIEKRLNQYIKAELLLKRMEDYIVLPGLGDISGLYGALALGLDARNA